MKVKLKKNGIQKNVKKGFSWTMLFFGFLVPVVRGDIKWAIITFLAAWVTLGISWLVFPFIYNQRYIEDLVSDGWSMK